MWSQKRVLKKEKKQLTKKRILLLSLICAGTGLSLIAVGLIILVHEPTFISPLPFLNFKAQTSDEQSKVLASKLKDQGMNSKEVKPIGASVYEIRLEDDSLIYITTEKNIDSQLSSLQRIASRLTMEGKKFVRLDLRYSKPVIVLQ